MDQVVKTAVYTKAAAQYPKITSAKVTGLLQAHLAPDTCSPLARQDYLRRHIIA